MTDLMRPQQRLGHSSTRNVHLVISLSKFQFSSFSASSLTTKYSAALLGSTVAGELNCCASQSNNNRCFFRTVTATHSNALKSSFTYSNVTKLDIFSSRLDTDWLEQLVKKYANSLESLSIICSNEPDGLTKLATEICFCLKLKCLRIEILSSRRFGNLHERLPNTFSNNLTEFGICVPVLSIDMLNWLDGLNPLLTTLEVNSVVNFDYQLLQSCLSTETKSKLCTIPCICPIVGAALNLAQLVQLEHVTIDCSHFQRPDSISSLIGELSSLRSIETITFIKVTVHTFALTLPLRIAPIESLKKICIRFSDSQLANASLNLFDSTVWSILLPFVIEVVFQNHPFGRVNYYLDRNSSEAKGLLLFDKYPFLKIFIE